MAIYETNINGVLSFMDVESYPKNEPLFIKREFIRDLSSTLRLIFQRMKYDSFIHAKYVLKNLTEKKMAR